MDSAARVTEEWSLEMNAKRSSLAATIPISLCSRVFAIFYCIREALESAQSAIHGGGYGGWKVAPDTMSDESALDCGQRFAALFHHVISRSAVDVQIKIRRRDDGIAEINHRNCRGKLPAAASGNLRDTALLNEQETLLDDIVRSQQPSCGKSQHRNASMTRIH
jgi:hypothetical protein